jgi:hypothetical protein
MAKRSPFFLALALRASSSAGDGGGVVLFFLAMEVLLGVRRDVFVQGSGAAV